jgi:RHS repeat-associated protein
VEVLQSNNNLTRFTYDDSNQTSVVSEVLNNTTFKSTYTYDSDKKLTELQDALNFKVGYGYDGFGRLSSKTFKTSLGTPLFTTSYTYTGYTESGVNYTSAQLASMTNGSSTITYTYDANGNITAITQGSTVIAYIFDDLGQVVRENNARDNKTIIYDYDLAGNILSRTTYPYTTGSVDGLTPISTFTYSYGNSVWKDQLTAFNGTAITYDDLGNPVEFGNRRYSWEKGRQLSGLSDTGLSASYTYNESGIRTSKTVNNVTTTYQLSGDKVTAEITGNQIIYYTYDASGHVVTMNANGVEYYVVRNGQNDVIALVDSTGTIVVEYTYSTYGEVLTITGSLASTIGALNPYRYRGYRYDNESGLYYLQSRYYNPVWGRFINADGLVATGSALLGVNQYAYCMNNPVNRTDKAGFFPRMFNEFAYTFKKVFESIINVVRTTPVINGVKRTHTTTPTLMIDAGVIFGKIGFSSTHTEKDSEEGLLYGFSDIGNNSAEQGVGFNLYGWLGAEGGYRTDGNAFLNVQVTPKLHASASIGVNGVGLSAGYIDGKNSHDFEITAGWGTMVMIGLVYLMPIAVPILASSFAK